MVHTHTKSLYNQDTQLLTYFIKDINNNENINIIDNDKNEKKLNINKNDNPNNINNYYYYITKFKFIKKDKNINKITKYKKSIKSDLINHKKESSDKGNLEKIIEELKLNNNNIDNKYGLTKKFIIAQNNWRLNYFASVIQKIYRGYSFRKQDYKKICNNKTINPIYIRKKAKDNHHIFGKTIHRKCPTEDNLNILFKNVNIKNSDYINKPPKIKEIVIMRNIKKDINNSINYSISYFNNYICNYNESFYIQNIFYKTKLFFDKWKEYSDKKKILYYLKTIKHKNKKIRLNSYEKKKRKNSYINFNKSFIKHFYK